MISEKIKIIAFDADDTLWVNEPYYRETEKKFCRLMEGYLPEEQTMEELLSIEISNIDLFGYGAKGFTLSMIETAIRISKSDIQSEIIEKIIVLGKELIEKPIELLDDIVPVLSKLKQDFKLILATKGDLLDQERKLRKSGLSDYFDHIEIMSDKKESNYIYLIRKLGIKAEEFLMIGNSVKSDVLPIIAIGGQAIHVPYHITWQHEEVDNLDMFQYLTINKLSDLIAISV